ncbi:MAG: EamA family transporter, partial [Thalassobaculaceae bacterium]
MGYALAVVMITFFASAPNFARLAFADGVDPLTFQLIRFSVAITGMGAAAMIFGWRVRGLAAHWPSLLALIVITLIASFGYMTSVRYIQVGLASLIFFCFPILVGVLTHVFGMERVSLRGGLGFLIAFAGLVLVFGVSFEAADPRGMALALAAGVAVACGFLITRRLSRFVPSPSVS